MIEEGEIVQALERVLADQSIFISRLQDMEPGCRTPEEVREIEKDIYEATDLMQEAIEGILADKPSPEIVGDRLKRSFDNLITILELLTRLIKKPSE